MKSTNIFWPLAISTVIIIGLSLVLGNGYELFWPVVMVGFGLISGVIGAVITLPFAWSGHWSYRQSINLIMLLTAIGSTMVVVRSQIERVQPNKIERVVINYNDPVG